MPEDQFDAQTEHVTDEEEEEDVHADSTLERQMWDHLMAQYHNPVAAAAIMGNAQGESSLYSYRLGNDVDKDENDEFPISKEFTRRVDSGEISRNGFIHPTIGTYDSYGLFCWYGNGRKGNLYDFAQERGTSVADWKMQLDFAYQEIVERYYNLYYILMTSSDIKTATDAFTQEFEQASRQDVDSGKRVAFARDFFNHFWGVKNVSPEYGAHQMLPVCQSYDYMDSVILEPGNEKSSIYVYILQIGLENLGYTVLTPGTTYSGFYGTTLEKSVREFQKDYGLEITGIFTPADWHVLAKYNGIEREEG